MLTRITWIVDDQQTIVAEVAEGLTLMEAAVAHNVPGIAAECGGACACATCHVVVIDREDALPAPSVIEEDMLDFVEAGRRPGSRLSCQLRVSPEMDGIRLLVPQR